MKKTSLALLLCSVSPSLWAAGTTGANFLDIPVGAGPAAVGSAYTALATDAYAPIWNAAGLGFVTGPEIAGQHLSYLDSIHEEFLSGVMPIKPGMGLGFSAQYLGSGDIAGTDSTGSPTGNYSDDFGAYTLSYGQRLSDRLSLGLSGKWIHADLDGVNANAFAADLGSLFRYNDQLNLGATLTNLGSKLNFLNEGDSLPLSFKMGAAYHPTRQWEFSSDLVVPKGSDVAWHGGIEWKPLDLISIRAGYRTDTTKDLSALAGFSTGIGIHVWGQEFAYAWVPYGDLGDTNYFSLVLRFGADAGPKNLSDSGMQPPHQISSAKSGFDEPASEATQLMQLLNQSEPGSQLTQKP